MGRHSGTRSSCSLLTPYTTRYQHRTNERLQTRLVSTNPSQLLCFSDWGTLEMLCASVRLGLIFCKVSLRLSVDTVTCRGQLQCRPPFYILPLLLQTPFPFSPHLLFFYAPVPLFLNSLSASVSFPLSPPVLCMCLWMRLSHVPDIFSHKSQREALRRNGRQRAASFLSHCWMCFSQFSSRSLIPFCFPPLFVPIRKDKTLSDSPRPQWYWMENKLRNIEAKYQICILRKNVSCIIISSQTSLIKSFQV